jgi:hypothetical protein
MGKTFIFNAGLYAAKIYTGNLHNIYRWEIVTSGGMIAASERYFWRNPREDGHLLSGVETTWLDAARAARARIYLATNHKPTHKAVANIPLFEPPAPADEVNA